MPKKMLAKYSVIGINDEGWMEPLPGNATNCVEITASFFNNISAASVPSL